MITKSEARKLQRDFIPGGKIVNDINKLQFRRTTELEVLQCCRVVGDDYPQSGYIYCGEIAEWVAINPDDPMSHVSLCERHALKVVKHES